MTFKSDELVLVVLAVKLFLTLSVWSIPLLFLPRDWLARIGLPVANCLIIYRLLGMAYLALAFVYASGFPAFNHPPHTELAVLVGLVSNGGASILLIANYPRWREWERMARLFMSFSAVATACISLALLILVAAP